MSKRDRDSSELIWLENSQVWARIPPKPAKQHDNEPSNKRQKAEDAKTLSTAQIFLNNDGDDIPTCSICLDEISIKDKAVLRNCMHEYHYDCISQWLAQKQLQNCPLCKIRPVSVLYDISAEDGTYEERELPTGLDTSSHPHRADIMTRLAEILGVSEFLRVRQRLEQDSALRRSRQDSGRRNRQLEQRPQAAPSLYSLRVSHHARASAATTDQQRGSASAHSHRHSNNSDGFAALERDFDREQEALILWRREIYDQELYAVPLGSQNHAPRSLHAPSGRQRRVNEWVDRELQALLDSSDNTIVKGFIMGLLATYGATPPERPSRLPSARVLAQLGSSSSSGGGQQRPDDPIGLLRPFLGDKSAHFWHELSCFATAPSYTIQTYDRLVKYARPGERRDRRQDEEERNRSRSGSEGGRRIRERSRSRERRRERYGERVRRDYGEERGERRQQQERGRRVRTRSRDGQRGGSAEGSGRGDERWQMWKWGDPIE